MSFDIIVTGLSRTIGRFEVAPRVIEHILKDTSRTVQKILEKEVKEDTPVYLGTLRASIHSREPRVTSPGRVVGDVVTGEEHALYVERGTKKHWPPVKEIEDWTRIKLGKGPDVAFLIARKIARHGTKPGKRMFRRAATEHLGIVQRHYRVAVRRINNSLTSRGPNI